MSSSTNIEIGAISQFLDPEMPSYHCCVAGCNNDSRYPEKLVKRSHVEEELKFRFFPKNESARKTWEKQVGKGLVGFQATNYKVVCSNHFLDGKPTIHGSPYPTLFLVPRDFNNPSPKKRKFRSSIQLSTDLNSETICATSESDIDDHNGFTVMPSLMFEHITRESDVRTFTGFTSPDSFKMIFNHPTLTTHSMVYWKGPSQTIKESKSKPTILDQYPEIQSSKRGPQRKLTLEQEF